ncbi:MAG: RecX family transcriptional regulator [Calditrichia bacterium]
MVTIADMKMRRGRPERFIVALESGEELVMSPEIVLEFGVAPGKQFDQNSFLKLLEADSRRRAQDQAMRYLALRPHSRQELEIKLRRKGYRPDTVNPVLTHLKKIDLLNDRQFARLFIQNEIRLHPSGKRLLQQKLFQKGIKKEISDELLRELLPEDLEMELAEQVAQKYCRINRRLPADRLKEKLVRHLQSKGFGWEEIRAVMSRPEDNFPEDVPS